MKRENRIRFFSHMGDRIVLGILAVLIIMILTLSALQAYAGLSLIHGELYVFLPLFIVLIALGWGMSAIFRRLKKPVIRGIGGTLMVIVMMGLTFIGMTYGTFAAGLSYPSRYAVVKSPGGAHEVVVMRRLDSDEARIAARRDERVKDLETNSQDIAIEDWGYTYTAYAMAGFGWFYRPATLKEGEVHIGYASKAELMAEWEDDETVAHFYIKNPEIGDDGEMRAVG